MQGEIQKKLDIIANEVLIEANEWGGWLLGGAYFFGLLGTLELYAKASGASWTSWLPSEAWAALPYLATVVVLAIISVSKSAGGNAPACLGKPFLPSS